MTQTSILPELEENDTLKSRFAIGPMNFIYRAVREAKAKSTIAVRY